MNRLAELESSLVGALQKLAMAEERVKKLEAAVQKSEPQNSSTES